MPGALEALDDILRRADSGELGAGETMAELLGSHIALCISDGSQTPCEPPGSPP